MENKPKVLILYNKLWHYRIPVWNILAERCDLTVTYSEGDDKDKDKCKFKVVYLPCHMLFNRFTIQNDNIREFSKKYDVVIAYGVITWLKFSTLPWFNKQKVIFWSLGVSASYDKHYDEDKSLDKYRKFFFNKADALVFYTDYPVNKYAAMGIDRRKMFVAHNTVEVKSKEIASKKDSILFIGTLYKQKGIQILLDSYLRVSKNYNLPTLNIIGKGPEYDIINEWIIHNGLSDKIKLLGAIYDVDKKSEFFSSAYACICPLQAGLSVLESMGYGVPFISSKDAITGGELFNIHNGENGIIIEDTSQIGEVLKDISLNPNKYIEMGRNAKSYYDNNRTPKHMADGLWEAIQFVLNN